MIPFPVRPNYHNQRDRQQQLNTITKMHTHYHNASLALLQDHIAFNESSSFLKRFYESHQYSIKIALLSQYYQYHQELPRIFQEHISEIIQNYQEDVRNLEYKFVRRKMRDESQLESGRSGRQKSSRPVEKIMKNIQLSYCNFEKKGKKRMEQSDRQKGSKSRVQGMAIDKKGSMPILTFYQYKNTKESAKVQIPNKDSNRNSNHPRSKDGQSKRVSATNSTDTPKNLSRTKSKSSLLPIHHNHTKKVTISPLEKQDKNTKTASSLLQKAESSRNIHQRRPLEERIDNKDNQKRSTQQLRKESAKKERQLGVKNMFRKVRQTKNMIRLK